jgi:hypothetical protein
MSKTLEIASDAVVQVGEGGRGFVVAGVDLHGSYETTRYIITAAHCLPHLPEPHLGRYGTEETFPNLIGPLGGKRPIWATLLFVDPMSDIAVFGDPDSQKLAQENDQYETFTKAIEPLPIGDMPLPPMPRIKVSEEGRAELRWLRDVLFMGVRENA